MLDWLQRKILRRSKHLGEHIDGLEVRRWDMNWNLDYSVGKNRDTLEGFFSVVSEPICAIKEVPEALFGLEKISKTPSGGSLGKKINRLFGMSVAQVPWAERLSPAHLRRHGLERSRKNTYGLRWEHSVKCSILFDRFSGYPREAP